MSKPRTHSTLIRLLGPTVLAAMAIVLIAGGCQDVPVVGEEPGEGESLRVTLTKPGDSIRFPDGTLVRIPTEDEVKATALRLLPVLRERLAKLQGPEGPAMAARREMTHDEAIAMTKEQIHTLLLDLAEIAERRGEPLTQELADAVTAEEEASRRRFEARSREARRPLPTN